jgi:SAM-dependent methyltransferase
VRRFDAEYLEATRRGMWDDSREALAPLGLSDVDSVLDVGCGTGELTRVLAAETEATVYGTDADPALLAAGRGSEVGDVFVGDATRLPVADDAVDLVVCQALLINLPDPARALSEFARVARRRVATVEPDNAAVSVRSTVEAERDLERRARAAYLDGVDTDVTLGAVPDRMRAAGLADVRTRRYDHVRTVEPPYDDPELAAARRKATGSGLADDRETMLDGAMTPDEYDDLRGKWRAMGRAVVAAMADGDYRREETVPFFVTVGEVAGGADE